tara:strand:+ start:393 stop:1517 length:1125 start_codon:yes stop_codon:yes gene_type:complete
MEGDVDTALRFMAEGLVVGGESSNLIEVWSQVIGVGAYGLLGNTVAAMEEGLTPSLSGPPVRLLHALRSVGCVAITDEVGAVLSSHSLEAVAKLAAPTPSKRPRIVVITALWKRPKLTRIILQQYVEIAASLNTEIELCGVAVGSEDEAERVANDAGWLSNGTAPFRYIQFPNNPLGRKHNVALAAAYGLDPDAMIIVGSDDLLGLGAFRLYVQRLKAGVHLVGFKDMWFYDTATGERLLWGGYKGGHSMPPSMTIGHGRMVSRPVLDACGWKLWEDSWDTGMDRALDSTIATACPTLQCPQNTMTAQWESHSAIEAGIILADIKTGTNLWSFDAVCKTGHTLTSTTTFEDLLDSDLPPHTKDALKTLFVESKL